MPESRTWREPTALLPLRWGEYSTRWAGGLLLIVAGAAAMAGSTTYSQLVLFPGWIAHFAGWIALPAAGWRRVVAAFVSSATIVFLLAGPRFIWITVLCYAAWLLVRHRPLSAYPTLTFVLAGAIIIARLLPETRTWAFGFGFALLVASAWAARLVHSAQGSPRDRRRVPSKANPQRPEAPLS